MKVKHTLPHSALAYQIFWMIKSTMPFHQHSPHHLTVSQPHVIPNNEDGEIDKVQWYTPAHVRQNEHAMTICTYIWKVGDHVLSWSSCMLIQTLTADKL